MRILIDLQGAQSESRFRGIGRYSLALALGIARNAGEHEIWLLLNGALGSAIGELRDAFAGLIAASRIRVFDIPAPVAEINAHNGARCRSAELLREHFIAQLGADMVLVTSLFEGYIDDAVVSVGNLGSGANTAVVLYDLIPFLNPAAYLGTPEQRGHYARKIASLRQAGLLLAISDYSRQEAIDALGLDGAVVAAISTAVDASFCPAAGGVAAPAALLARLGIIRPFLMYAPGGFDTRKNIDGLITAFSLLPAPLRAAHQLVIASKLGEHERHLMDEHARHCGLQAHELVLTGYVSDADLIALYRATALFIFPSKHEGFGLPALEAMACGALVIGADNTSIPEVIGCAEALFDATSPSAIAAKIGEVLADATLQARLRAHGRAQAARFSWDLTAQRALRAIETHHAQGLATAPAVAARPRLAMVTPLPPERSGVADYVVQLLPALLVHFDIELIIEQDDVLLPAPLATLLRRPPEWLARHADHYDLIVYQFGNSPLHGFMFPLLQAYPGLVVLHDFFLGDVLAHQQASGARPGAWTDALYHAHGHAALASLARDGIEATKLAWPCNLAVLEAATAVIVHSEHARRLAHHWYGAQLGRRWNVLPLPRAAPAQHARAAARAALGLRQDAFVACSFGFIATTKLIHELVQAWSASSLGADADCELILVGANHIGDYGGALRQIIAKLGAGARIRINGWTGEAQYQQYLQAADLGIQLRGVSRGETSAAVLDCMNYGVATIVNANGALADLPDDAVWKMPDTFAPAELVTALETLRREPARRQALGARGAQLLHSRHSPATCAAQYAQAFTSAIEDGRHERHALVKALAAQGSLATDEQNLQQLAFCLAGMPDPLIPRQLLFDVSSIARHDLQTGIERVVRTQLLELLRQPLPGLRVEPVYFSNKGGHPHYRYAQAYTSNLLGASGPVPADAVVDIGPRDLFYSADYAVGAVLEAARAGLYANWRARGVGVFFLVYDLLPVLRPAFFPPHADLQHQAWLEAIATNADALLCISGAVQRELTQWLGARPAPARSPRALVLPLGADLDAYASNGAATATPLLAPAAMQTFLMVGTIEPRKGHLQALAAFELLWARGVDVRLVIVGNEGWLPLTRSERRTIPHIVETLERHPQRGVRLLWFKGITDAELQQLYQSSACLLAPSEGEGFGLPLIEAARYRLPVIARDLPVFQEVAGEHAFYFNGLEAAALADAIVAWLALHAAASHPVSEKMRWSTWQENVKVLLALLDDEQGALPTSLA